MLSLVSMTEAANARGRSVMGASMPAAPAWNIRERGCAGSTVLPRSAYVASQFGTGHTAAASVLAGQRHSSQKSTYQTRIAPDGGAAPGSHPARDPV